VSIFVINAALGRSLLESGLFALAIAVGLTPQLLPAIVTISLSTGARRLARAQVVVKRLVAIEDLGNIQVLCTDKTGTLTEGRIRFDAALDLAGAPSAEVLRLGLLCNEAIVENGRVVAGNPLDQALWEAALDSSGPDGAATRAGGRGGADGADPLGGARRLALRRSTTTAAWPRRWSPSGTGGAAWSLRGSPGGRAGPLLQGAGRRRRAARPTVASGARVIAVATRDGAGMDTVAPVQERDLELAGFLSFSDPPKTGAAASLARLRSLGIQVKVLTGDNDRVAVKVCDDLGIVVRGTLTARGWRRWTTPRWPPRCRTRRCSPGSPRSRSPASSRPPARAGCGVPG
jgi:P-type Mg2+ transporter